jgi:hypothetical protein
MFVTQYLTSLNVIHALSIESMGLAVGLQALANAASAAYVSANRAVYLPFHVPVARVLTKLMTPNGATASDNVDMGIYAAESGLPGRRIVSIGSTAQSGTDALQYYDIADTLLGAGDYFLAVAMNGTTGTLHRLIPSIDNLRRGGMFQEASAFPLPATATPATITSAYLPVIGLVF